MTPTVNKQAIAAAFGRAARVYNQHAELQRLCGDRLMLLARGGAGLEVLDAGCGTGWFSQRWQQGEHRVTALDLSAEMLRQAASTGVADCYRQGDIESLPFADACFDRCWSNLAVQWCSSLRRGLQELNRVTRPGGQVLFSLPVAGSLHQLTQAWASMDAPPPLNPLLSPPDVNDAVHGMNARLQPLTLTLAYPDALSVLRSLNGTGVNHLHHGGRRLTLGRSGLRQLEDVWPRDGRGYLLTWQLILGVIERE